MDAAATVARAKIERVRAALTAAKPRLAALVRRLVASPAATFVLQLRFLLLALLFSTTVLYVLLWQVVPRLVAVFIFAHPRKPARHPARRKAAAVARQRGASGGASGGAGGAGGASGAGAASTERVPWCNGDSALERAWTTLVAPDPRSLARMREANPPPFTIRLAASSRRRFLSRRLRRERRGERSS